MNVASPSHRPRSWRFQFSLRLLLLAFTAFAIGFPLWYRWPYEEREINRTGTNTQITTWQRQWGGGRKKHGLQRLIINGKTIESLVYRNDLRHGPYESTYAGVGQFVNDKREGVWTAPDRTMTWHNGKLDGQAEIRLPPERPLPPQFASKRPESNELRKFQLVFADGRLTHFNGKPAAGRLFELLDDDTVDQRLRMELSKTTTVDLVEMPLKDTVIYLSELHAIPIVLDPQVNGDLPITGEFLGIDLCSALTLITAPHNVGCDSRYGRLWITTAEDCVNWQDPTGVCQIRPPQDSILARAWNEPIPGQFYNTQLADVFAKVAMQLSIEIDASRVEPTSANSEGIPVTTNRDGFLFRDFLGYVLYKTHCRCQLQGDKLVILPPEENKTDPKSQ